MKNLFLLFITACCIILATNSCKKDTFITSPNAQLNLTDTVKFDTVFTSIGSITKSFKIFNENTQKLLISKIKLMGSSTSPFRLNINGVAATELIDIEIASNDSIYVFVSVSINPSASNLPFIITDSVLINYNGNTRYVQLQAYGQNAIYLNNQVITGTVSWTNTLPYVILGGMRIDTTAILNIAAGTKIYLHADAPFIVDGTLLLNGTINEKIVFTGDRLDEPYVNFPASWPGIYFRESSKNNVLNFAVIKNASQAVVSLGPSVNTNPKIVLQQVEIDNASDAGLLLINSNAEVNNSLIRNCGSNVVIQRGGNYSFTHCTVASYSTLYLLHSKPVLSVADYGLVNGVLSFSSLDALFKNCIFWGENNALENEISIIKQGTNTFSVTMDHCLYKALNDPSNTDLISVIKNIDPVFDSIDYTHNYFDFRISKDPLAPGIDNGTLTTFVKDLDDNQRNIIIPDIGCYEKQ